MQQVSIDLRSGAGFYLALVEKTKTAPCGRGSVLGCGGRIQVAEIGVAEVIKLNKSFGLLQMITRDRLYILNAMLT